MYFRWWLCLCFGAWMFGSFSSAFAITGDALGEDSLESQNEWPLRPREAFRIQIDNRVWDNDHCLQALRSIESGIERDLTAAELNHFLVKIAERPFMDPIEVHSVWYPTPGISSETRVSTDQGWVRSRDLTAQSQLEVSFDHGATWRFQPIPLLRISTSRPLFGLRTGDRHIRANSFFSIVSFRQNGSDRHSFWRDYGLALYFESPSEAEFVPLFGRDTDVYFKIENGLIGVTR